jgi:nucleoside-diphosphate-sugar epimerase
LTLSGWIQDVDNKEEKYDHASMKIFITGGTGFIGSHLVDLLVKSGHEVASYDASLNFISNPKYHLRCLKLRREYLTNHPHKEFVGDIRDLESLKKAVTEFLPEVIVHLAGLPMARVADQYKEEMEPINMQGTLNTVNVFEESTARRLVYTSSSMSYGHFKQHPQGEDSMLDPINDYGACKASGEYFVKLTSKEWVIVRPTSVYGFSDCANRITQLLMDRAYSNQPAWIIRGETLDFSYVKDVANGFYKCTTMEEANRNTFNISSGDSRSTEELASLYKNRFPNFKCDIKEADKQQVWRGPLDISKARKILGYEPKYSLEDGIKETLNLVDKYGFYNELI